MEPYVLKKYEHFIMLIINRNRRHLKCFKGLNAIALVSSSSWCLKAVACDYGTPWTFL